MISDKAIRALTILSNTDCINLMRVRTFSELYFDGQKILLKVSNQGNGACHGKAAWLCAGSFLAKLRKLGLVELSFYRETAGYFITKKGIEELTMERRRNGAQNKFQAK